TYEVAWRRFDRVPAGDESIAWLLAVARNHLRNHRRRIIRDRDLLTRLPAPAHSDPSGVCGGADWQDVRRALGALRTGDRELLLLISWDELTPAQTAVVLGTSSGAARARLHRARRRLAAELDRLSAEPSASGRTSAPPNACKASTP
ncbi:MAG: sigma factor-like helix-turn-helix DNA-binding protein, partial [Solirubrobacteraceae bacterium]